MMSKQIVRTWVVNRCVGLSVWERPSVTGFSEHSNELSGCLEGRNFLAQISCCQLLKSDPASWYQAWGKAEAGLHICAVVSGCDRIYGTWTLERYRIFFLWGGGVCKFTIILTMFSRVRQYKIRTDINLPLILSMVISSNICAELYTQVLRVLLDRSYMLALPGC